jgi:cytochrome oxidase Cu insertion factor (SCO1/SenC/PrrC family)
MACVLFVFVTTTLWLGAPPAEDKSKDKAQPAIGKPAPEIEGEDIDGNPFKLSDYRGKVVVLDFWGNW